MGRARIIAIANQKGGTGKTTITVGLAAVLHRAGISAGVVDVDPQRSAYDWLSQIKDCPIPRHLQRTPTKLREMSKLPVQYVLADTPGSLEGEDALDAVASAADFLIIPLEPAGLSMRPTLRTIKTIIEPTGAQYRILLNKVRPQALAAARSTQTMLREEMGLPVFDGIVRLLSPHEHASTRNVLITDIKGADRACNDLREVALELLASQSPLAARPAATPKTPAGKDSVRV